MARLSIAVWPPPRIVTALASLDRPAVEGVRWPTASQWMVKVRPLGAVNGRLVPDLAAPVHGLEDLAAGSKRPRD